MLVTEKRMLVVVSLLLTLPWLCVGLSLTGISFSKNLKGDTRPNINNLLPLLKLLQAPSPVERDNKELIDKLGDEYNPHFTSIDEPDAMKARDPSLHLDEATIHEHLKNHPLMGDELKHMKFFAKKSNGKKKEYGKRITHKFRHWLWSLSRCPVRYRWYDLGANIFPRFIKVGQCSKKKTCSFPAGMKCQMKSWKEITVLIYTCIKEMNSVAAGCQWRAMKISILTECQCGCKTVNDK